MMKNKLLLIPKILLLVSVSLLLAIYLIDFFKHSNDFGQLAFFLPLITLTVMSFVEPKLGGILLCMCTIFEFLVFIMLVLAFGGEFRLFERIPLLLIFYMIVSVLFIVFSKEKIK